MVFGNPKLTDTFLRNGEKIDGERKRMLAA